MPAKLKLGDNVNGYSWVGGDPADRKSWVNPDELASKGLKGDEFLGLISKEHPSLVPVIKAISEGRQEFAKGKAQTDAYWQTMMALAHQYDPSLDQVDFSSRQATRKDFTAGPSANNIRNLNQAIGHLHALVEAVPGVAGHQGLFGLSHWLNQAQNAYKQGNGDPGITAYDVPRTALSAELAAVFKGKGSSAEAEVEKFYKMLDPSNSTAQKHAGARGLVELLNSRLDELGQQYGQGMGTTKSGIELLNPVAKQQFGKLAAVGLPPDKVSPAVKDETVDPNDPTTLLLKKYKVLGGTP